MKKILIIGSGAREHCIGNKIKQDLGDRVNLHFAPGNGGTSTIGHNTLGSPLNYALNKSIDLTIVGPEQPLIDGIVNEFDKQGLKIFGPSDARLEGSKFYAKTFMTVNKIPTSWFKSFTDINEAKNFAKKK